jgi:hypothetical protein
MKCVLLSADADHKCELDLPFAPFKGLNLIASWAGDDYVVINQVFYDHKKAQFEAYAEEYMP